MANTTGYLLQPSHIGRRCRQHVTNAAWTAGAGEVDCVLPGPITGTGDPDGAGNRWIEHVLPILVFYIGSCRVPTMDISFGFRIDAWNLRPVHRTRASVVESNYVVNLQFMLRDMQCSCCVPTIVEDDAMINRKILFTRGMAGTARHRCGASTAPAQTISVTRTSTARPRPTPGIPLMAHV